MARTKKAKMATAIVIAVALLGVFYLDDHVFKRDHSYSLLEIVNGLVLYYYAFFKTPRMEMKIAELEKRLKSDESSS